MESHINFCVWASFTRHGVFEVYPHHSMNQRSIPLYYFFVIVWMITLCLSIHPLMDIGLVSTFSLFLLATTHSQQDLSSPNRD